MIDLRWPLFAATVVLLWRTIVYFINWRSRRSMPLLLGLFLVSVFIWIGKNVDTYTQTWIYPGQKNGWAMVSVGKLLLVSAFDHRVRAGGADQAAGVTRHRRVGKRGLCGGKFGLIHKYHEVLREQLIQGRQLSDWIRS